MQSMSKYQGISIIIPTYNEAGTIKVLLQQLFSYIEHTKVEVIVVDANGSDDNLSKHLSGFPLSVVKSHYTSRAIQMNEGAKLAKYDILYFVHADAIPPKSFHTNILDSLAKGNHFGYFSYKFDSQNFLLKINSYFSKFKSFYTGGGDQTFFILKSLFDSFGGYDSGLELCEDFDLYHRLKKSKKRFEIINENVKISDRKYQKSNYLWINLVNFYILLRFKMGHNPNNLRHQYSKLLR